MGNVKTFDSRLEAGKSAEVRNAKTPVVMAEMDVSYTAGDKVVLDFDAVVSSTMQKWNGDRNVLDGITFSLYRGSTLLASRAFGVRITIEGNGIQMEVPLQPVAHFRHVDAPPGTQQRYKVVAQTNQASGSVTVSNRLLSAMTVS